MQSNYTVHIEDFAQKHFIKNFEKKYKSHWNITLLAILAELERIDMLLLTDRAETVYDGGDVKIIKTKFKVVKSKESATTSGNRCIIAWHKNNQFVSILLVYGKTDLGGGKETSEWKNIVKDNYPQYCNILK